MFCAFLLVVVSCPRRAVSDMVADLQRQIANLHGKLQRVRRSYERREYLLDQQALLIFIYSGYRAEVAGHFYLSMSHSKSTLQSAVEHVEWKYINAPLEDKVAVMLDPCARHSVRQALASFRYITLFRLYEWIRKMNYESGVAPSRRMLADRLPDCFPEMLPDAWKVRLLRPMGTARSQRRYFCAFRSHFCCKLGKVKTIPPMSADEMRHKVLRLLKKMCSQRRRP